MKSGFYVHVIFLIIFVNINPSLTSSANFRRLRDFDDQTVSQSLMWTLRNLTIIQCGTKCLGEKYCISVDFCATGGVCMALRKRFDGENVATDVAPGYRLYQANKSPSIPGSACELGVDCLSLSNSNCKNGHCQCNVGYGTYGERCRILTECTDFSDEITFHQKKLIGGYDVKSGSVTREGCKQMCINDPKCRSADYHNTGKPRSRCYVQHKSWYDVPSANRQGHNYYDHYQRECNW